MWTYRSPHSKASKRLFETRHYDNSGRKKYNPFRGYILKRQPLLYSSPQSLILLLFSVYLREYRAWSHLHVGTTIVSHRTQDDKKEKHWPKNRRRHLTPNGPRRQSLKSIVVDCFIFIRFGQDFTEQRPIDRLGNGDSGLLWSDMRAWLTHRKGQRKMERSIDSVSSCYISYFLC